MFQERGFSYPRIRLLTLAMGHGWSGRGLIEGGTFLSPV